MDSGMVKTVTSDNIVQLPLALCDVPPLVICMAVPPTDVGTRSLGRISEGSLIICKFSMWLSFFVDFQHAENSVQA